jgi:hypothetical protein
VSPGCSPSAMRAVIPPSDAPTTTGGWGSASPRRPPGPPPARTCGSRRPTPSRWRRGPGRPSRRSPTPRRSGTRRWTGSSGGSDRHRATGRPFPAPGSSECVSPRAGRSPADDGDGLGTSRAALSHVRPSGAPSPAARRRDRPSRGYWGSPVCEPLRSQRR